MYLQLKWPSFSPLAPKIIHSFKTPPHKSVSFTTSSQLALNKEPSPAALHSLLHGRILSESPELTSAGSSLVTTAEQVHSDQVTAVAENVVGESPDLFEESKKQSGEPGVSKTVGGSTSKAARMLTYDSEDPLVHRRIPKSILKTPDNSSKDHSSELPSLATTPPSRSCFLSSWDSNNEHESASMAAFALSTPTKEDPVDFHQAFQDN